MKGEAVAAFSAAGAAGALSGAPCTTTTPRAQVLATLMHANHLEREYGAGPHTISVPRMRPADGSDVRDTRACSRCQPKMWGCWMHGCNARDKQPSPVPSLGAYLRACDACPQVSLAPPYAVDDANFKKLVAILRIAVPYTGMILRCGRRRRQGWRACQLARGSRTSCSCRIPVWQPLAHAGALKGSNYKLRLLLFLAPNALTCPPPPPPAPPQHS